MLYRASQNILFHHLLRLRGNLEKNLRHPVYLTPRKEGGFHWFDGDRVVDIRFHIPNCPEFPNVYKADPLVPIMDKNQRLSLMSRTPLKGYELRGIFSAFKDSPFVREYDVFLL